MQAGHLHWNSAACQSRVEDAGRQRIHGTDPDWQTGDGSSAWHSGGWLTSKDSSPDGRGDPNQRQHREDGARETWKIPRVEGNSGANIDHVTGGCNPQDSYLAIYNGYLVKLKQSTLKQLFTDSFKW